MRRAVRVAERNPVIGHVEVAVGKPAQCVLRAAIRQAGTVDIATRQGRHDREDRHVIRTGRDEVLDIGTVDDRLRLGGFERSLCGRRIRVEPRSRDHHGLGRACVVGHRGTGEAFTETQWLTVRPDIAPYPF